jgi:hypothetical protein
MTQTGPGDGGRAISASVSIPLAQIEPSADHTERPKGNWPYKPYAKTQLLADRILERYQLLARQDALPAGPRTIGYRLKEAFRSEYSKADFKNIGRVITRLCQAGNLRWDWVADGSAVDYGPGGWDSEQDFLRDAHRLFGRDLRGGQPVVIEVGTEARETAGLIRRVCHDSGVRAYSGGGSSGPGLARKVALRALERAATRGQSTLLLWLGDFDQAGIGQIVRPHIEHVAAFLYGSRKHGKLIRADQKVLAWPVDGRLVTMAQTGCTVSFRHLGLTPQMALERAETAELTQADTDAIAAYAASGEDIWDRDLALLEGVARFELEAMNPPEVRNLLAGAIGHILDHGVLEQTLAERPRFSAPACRRCWPHSLTGWTGGQP